MRPLADEIRPQTLDEVAGQKHLLGEGAMLRRLIESGSSANLIFYGPSGTGKTTIANIIAQKTEKTIYHLNATTASAGCEEYHCRRGYHAGTQREPALSR